MHLDAAWRGTLLSLGGEEEGRHRRDLQIKNELVSVVGLCSAVAGGGRASTS